jgi:hypothetical protein
LKDAGGERTWLICPARECGRRVTDLEFLEPSASSQIRQTEENTNRASISGMNPKQFVFAWAFALGALVSAPNTFAKDKTEKNCKVYFMVVEHDELTSNLNMVGLNQPQREWFEKHGAKDAPGLCLVNGNAAGSRVTVETADENYIESIVGTSPLYSIAWEEHRVFVPDNNGGHNAFQASGILSIWTATADGGKGDFVPISPVHDTNRTIFTSSSASLLKSALKELGKRVGGS